MSTLRLTVRVRPGASRNHVGGEYGEGELIVAVNAPPVDGAANEAVIRAIAASFDIRARGVSLVSGHQSRTKVLELDIDDVARARARLSELLAASG